jgi:hypothetical protein
LRPNEDFANQSTMTVPSKMNGPNEEGNSDAPF